MSSYGWLAEAVEDAVWPALEEAAREAVQAAIRGDELPANSEVLIEAAREAKEALGEYWNALIVAVLLSIDGQGNGNTVADARFLVERMTEVTLELLDRAAEGAAR